MQVKGKIMQMQELRIRWINQKDDELISKSNVRFLQRNSKEEETKK